MNKKNSLLPSGFYDLLPKDAGKEHFAICNLLSVFSAFGYDLVSPPLVEFESSLLAERGDELSERTMRVHDAISQKIMGIRSDITLQIARIALTRLLDSPRPLRLCYSGQIIQSKPESLRNERQLTQAGIEMIGNDSMQADAEIIIIASEALAKIGINDISIDINLPGLLYKLCPEAHTDKILQKQIKDAIICKDIATISALDIKNSDLLSSLVSSAGAVEKSLSILNSCAPEEALFIKELVENLYRNCPNISLTLDPVEYCGFDYHDGISFSIFAKDIRHEIGRGGRYKVGAESATGFTIYVTHLLSLLPELENTKLILVDKNLSIAILRDLQKQGFRTLYASSDNIADEAEKIGAGQYVSNNKGL